MEGGDYTRIPLSSLSVSPFLRSFHLPSLVSLCLSISLFAKTVISASNKHSELSLKKSARRTNGNARPSPLHTYIFLFLRRLENQRFTPSSLLVLNPHSSSLPGPFSQMHSRGFCLRVSPPLFVSETFSSARGCSTRSTRKFRLF